MKTFHQLKNYIDTLKPTSAMPALFLGHGSPMNAIEENQFVRGFREVAKSIPRPKAILCISAHWLTNGTKVTGMESPRTIHDFGGFPKALYQVQYSAPGSPELANQTKKMLAPSVVVELDDQWGLDHGAWSVIKHLYPEADIPVIQMSIDYKKEASYHFQLGKALHELRNKGVLIIGSGNIIHNLRMVDFHKINEVGYGYDWAIESHQIINGLLKDHNFEELMDYQKLGRSVHLSIPTPDHYYPLMYTLGLKQKGEELYFFNDELLAGSISMTSLMIS